MAVITLKTQADANRLKSVNFGDEFDIDVYPDPPESDKDVETYDKRFEQAKLKSEKIQAILNKKLGADKSDIDTIKEKYTVKDLRDIAKENGIKVSGNEEKIIKALLDNGVKL